MSHIRRVGYLLVLLIGGSLLTAMAWKPAPPPKFVGIASAEIPRSVGGYAAPVDYQQPPEALAQLAAADIVSRYYNHGADTIDFVLIGGTDRTALHDPRSCLIGSGNKIEQDHTERLPGTSVDARACQVIGQPGAPSFDMIYVYVVDGKIVNQVTQIRAAMLMSAILGRQNTPVYFLRFMQPLSADAQENAASHARLQLFAAQMWTQLQPKIVKR